MEPEDASAVSDLFKSLIPTTSDTIELAKKTVNVHDLESLKRSVIAGILTKESMTRAQLDLLVALLSHTKM